MFLSVPRASSMADHYTFDKLIDLIGGPVSEWPRCIYEAYQKQKYEAKDRLKLCLFNYINGFNNEVFIEFCVSNHKLSDKKAYDDLVHIRAVLEEGKKNLNTWFSFNLVQKRWMYLNGNTKYY